MSDERSGVPVVTWVVGGTALFVAAIALFLAVRGRKEPVPLEADAPPVVSASPKTLDLVPPMSISAVQRDARERARLWKEHATLTSLSVIAEAGKIKSGPSFEFIERGAPLSGKLVLEYTGDDVRETHVDKGTGLSVEEPNCPLESAFATLRAFPGVAESTLAIAYGHSKKHGRAVWVFSRSGGEPIHVDGASCSLLVR